MKFGLYATGQKGRIVLMGLSRRPEFVVTYQDKNKSSADYGSIVDFCHEHHIPVYDREKAPSWDDIDLVFFIGWQYMIWNEFDKCVVLHDSYLPEMRGFAPTPTSMILGLPLGATAFQPTGEIDSGPIYIRRRIEVDYPMRLSDAEELVGKNYIEMIEEILIGKPESFIAEEPPTYSIWRDKMDMFIDWNKPAEYIQRFVYALGSPLSGAKTTYNGKTIIVREVSLQDDLNFIDRHPGKIWSLKNGRPTVICSSGMIVIEGAVYEDETPVEFNRLRERLGK